MGRGGRCGYRVGVIVVTVALAIVGVACSDPPDPGSDASASTTTTPATTTTTQDVAADVALAQQALLATSEVPGGPWTEGEARPAGESEGFDCPALAEGARFFDENAKDAPGAAAPDLESAGVTVQLDITIVATEDVADRVSAFVGDPLFSTCLEGRVEAQATADRPRGVTLRGVSVEPADLAPLGDASAAWAISFELTQGTQTAKVSGTYVVVQVGRGFALVSLIGTEPFAASDVLSVASAATEQLAAALGE